MTQAFPSAPIWQQLREAKRALCRHVLASSSTPNNPVQPAKLSPQSLLLPPAPAVVPPLVVSSPLVMPDASVALSDNSLSDHCPATKNPKSYAQGGTSVRPLSDHNSRELKLDRKQPTVALSKRPPKLEFRLSESEKETVREKASRLGMSLTEYAKTMLLDEFYDPALRNALLALNRQLTGMGTNINQATARLHRDGNDVVYAAALEELRRPLLDTLSKLRAVLANINDL